MTASHALAVQPPGSQPPSVLPGDPRRPHPVRRVRAVQEGRTVRRGHRVQLTPGRDHRQRLVAVGRAPVAPVDQEAVQLRLPRRLGRRVHQLHDVGHGEVAGPRPAVLECRALGVQPVDGVGEAALDTRAHLGAGRAGLEVGQRLAGLVGPQERAVDHAARPRPTPRAAGGRSGLAHPPD